MALIVKGGAVCQSPPRRRRPFRIVQKGYPDIWAADWADASGEWRPDDRPLYDNQIASGT